MDVLVKEWKQFKARVPTYGCVILDQSFKYCLLVHGFSSSSWGFPKGKVNQGELPHECALREVEEEVGVDFTDNLLQDDYLDKEINGRSTRMYFVVDVPFKTEFAPKCRGEIKDIKWFPIDSLPKFKSDTTPQLVLGMQPAQFFMVIPFVEDVLAWVDRYNSKQVVSEKFFTNNSGVKKDSPFAPGTRLSAFHQHIRTDQRKSSDSRSPQGTPRNSKQQQASSSPAPNAASTSTAKNTDTPNIYQNVIIHNSASKSAKKNKTSSASKKQTGTLADNRVLSSTSLTPVSVNEKLQPREIEDFKHFRAASFENFKVDIKAMMLAWDGWP